MMECYTYNLIPLLWSFITIFSGAGAIVWWVTWCEAKGRGRLFIFGVPSAAIIVLAPLLDCLGVFK